MSRKMCYNILQNDYSNVETMDTNIFNSLEMININELFGFIEEFSMIPSNSILINNCMYYCIYIYMYQNTHTLSSEIQER